MAILAVLAHHDPRGEIAHHVRYQLDRLRPAADRLVFVTAGRLTPAARAALSDVDDVIERDNTGYDFGSWRAGLLANPDWPDHDRLILTNDSYVGPLIPAADLLADADRKGADAYGITTSGMYGRHVQSYFTVFSPRLLRSAHFQAFWLSMKPLDDREAVIDHYELGIARLYRDLGARVDSYFAPTAWQSRVGLARNVYAFADRPVLAAGYRFLRPGGAGFSPIHMLWSAALSGELPAVKIAHFRERNPKPAGLRRDLARLEARYPDAFAGFADYLAATGGPDLRGRSA